MRIVRNVGYVKRKKRTARWTALLGFVTLVGSMIVGFVLPDLFGLAYLLLFVGFVLFNVGMQQVGKWNRGPKNRNDALLDQRLAPFNDRYALIHFPSLNDKVVEHLLVHPGGVTVLTAKDLPGEVIVQGKRWRRAGNPLRRVFAFSGPQLGQPGSETQQGIATVEGFLAEHQMEVDVDGAVVFVNPRIVLDVEDAEFPVLTADELPDFVRDLPIDESLRPSDLTELVDLLSVGDELETTARTRSRRPVRKRAA
jgi:hypothetical protein